MADITQKISLSDMAKFIAAASVVFGVCFYCAKMQLQTNQNTEVLTKAVETLHDIDKRVSILEAQK